MLTEYGYGMFLAQNTLRQRAVAKLLEMQKSASRSGLGGLSACVGVNLSIEYEDVNVLAGSNNVVKSGRAGVPLGLTPCLRITQSTATVCSLHRILFVRELLQSFSKCVAAEYPHGLLAQVILKLQNLCGSLGLASLQSLDKLGFQAASA